MVLYIDGNEYSSAITLPWKVSQRYTNYVSTPNDVLAEILQWSQDRPNWQRDALRRLFSAGGVTQKDLDDLVHLCKATRGLTEPVSPKLLASEHLAIKDAGADAISLGSMTHHQGANALAVEQTIAFGSHLTIVYGQNAAGKSGYTRILKQACRSRFSEEIFGNLLSESAPPKLKATITFRQGPQGEPETWAMGSPPSDALASVSVFDSRCAPVYLSERNDVAFRPFGLDIFDQLAALCDEIRKRLEGEKTKLNALVPALPTLPEGTRPRSLIDHLTSLTRPDDIQALATLSEVDQRRIDELRAYQRDLLASDPKKRARELTANAERIELLGRHIAVLFTTFRVSAITNIATTAGEVRVAQAALDLLRASALTDDLLPGTGGDTWHQMWEAAEAFSAIAYPGTPFPALMDEARCPFCQQDIGGKAQVRLLHLAEFAASTAQARVRDAERIHRAALMSVLEATVRRPEIDLVVAELQTDNPMLGQEVETFLQAIKGIQQGIEEAQSKGIGFVGGMTHSPEAKLSAVAEGLRERARQLLVEKPAMSPKAAAELRELEARVSLRENLQKVLDEIERQKMLAVYDQCIADTSTKALTRKSTELTSRLITDQLRAGFKEELERLEFDHLAVEIREAGGTKGTLFHKLVFSNAPKVSVARVLSEGESRTLSLASFLTELKTAAGKSAIIFDDPVSSLDHMWRERIGRRLVSEAEGRQVIVFTHDLLFLRILEDEAVRLGVDCKHQYIRRGDIHIGLCSEDLPSVALNTKQRVGRLRSRWQEAEKVYRTDSEKYEDIGRRILQLIREAWEHAIAEVLLADVVQRYRPSIETKKVRFLHDITIEDCKAVEKEMTETSRWLHDQPLADGAPFPTPKVLKQHIDDLESWVAVIRRRRNS